MYCTELPRIQFVRDCSMSVCTCEGKEVLELRMHGCTYYMLVLMCVWLMCVVQFEVSWFFYQEFTGAGQVSSTCLWFTRTDNTTITLLSRSQIKHKHFTPHTSPLPTMPWEWKRVIIRVTCVCTVWYVRSFVVASYVFTCMSNLAVLCRQTSLKLSSGNVSLPMLQMQIFLIVLEFGVGFTGGNTLKSNVCMQL